MSEDHKNVRGAPTKLPRDRQKAQHRTGGAPIHPEARRAQTSCGARRKARQGATLGCGGTGMQNGLEPGTILDYCDMSAELRTYGDTVAQIRDQDS